LPDLLGQVARIVFLGIVPPEVVEAIFSRCVMGYFRVALEVDADFLALVEDPAERQDAAAPMKAGRRQA
jgi:hypothetical protein